MKTSPFNLRLPGKALARANISSELPENYPYALPYARPQRILFETGEIIRQSYTGMEFYLEQNSTVVTQPTDIKLRVKRKQVTLLYVLKSSNFALLQENQAALSIPYDHYSAFCLPEGKYRLHLEKGLHVFLFFTLQTGYLKKATGRFPHLSVLLHMINNRADYPGLFALRKIDQRIKNAIKRLHLCKGTGANLNAALLSIILYMTETYCYQLSQQEPQLFESSRELVYAAKEWMLERARRAPLLLISEVARHFHITPGTFARVFQECFHCSPQQFITEVRMQEARRLLKEERLLIKTVAEKLGYSEISTFSKLYKKHFGYPPSSFQEEKGS